MMISMTGFGTSTVEFRMGSLQIDIKTVNSKGMEVALRVPQWLKDKELELRRLFSEKLLRGKVEITVAEIQGNKEVSIDWNLLKSYFLQIKEFQEDNNIQDTHVLSALLQLPEIQKNRTEALNDDEFRQILLAIESAILQLLQFRKSEGEAMKGYIYERIEELTRYCNLISEIEPMRTERVRNKLWNGLQNMIPELVDKNRLEQEMIFYVEKLDIQEELSRLKAHIAYFNAIVEDEKAEKGKRLGFISQEFLREANTIGSKANDAEIQQLVVKLKDEIEKIKEQLNNVL